MLTIDQSWILRARFTILPLAIVGLALSVGAATTASCDDFHGEAAAQKKIKPVTATKVIDSRKHVVGTIFAVSTVGASSGLGNPNQAAALVGFSGDFYLIGVTATGFRDQSVQFVFHELDCSGEAFLPVSESSALFYDAAGVKGSASVSAGTLYFAQQPFSVVNVFSRGFGRNPAEAAANCAIDNLGNSITVGSVASFDLSLLGFVPPFSMK